MFLSMIKPKKEIISMSAGKSVDMTDINHGHNMRFLPPDKKYIHTYIQTNKQSNKHRK